MKTENEQTEVTSADECEDTAQADNGISTLEEPTTAVTNSSQAEANKQSGTNAGSTQPGPTALDLAEAKRFVHRLDPGTDKFVFQTFDDDKKRRASQGNIDPRAKTISGTLANKAKELVRRNGDGAGVYVTIAETGGNRRTGARIRKHGHVRAVFAEDDNPRSAPRTDFPLKPHIIVESSPEKYHYYWLVDQLDFDTFLDVQRAVATTYNTDSTAVDVARVLRMLGFLHQKDPKKPFLTRIVFENKGKAYTRDEIEKAFPPQTSAAKPSKRRSSSTPQPTSGIAHDPALVALDNRKLLRGPLPNMPGGWDIECPWADGHSGGDTTGTAYFEPNYGGYKGPGFKCHHNSCSDRTARDLMRVLGVQDDAEVARLKAEGEFELHDFDLHHGMTMIGGKAVVLYREHDHDRDCMVTRFTTTGSLNQFYANITTPAAVERNKDGELKVKYEPIAPAWLKLPSRRTYRQVIMKPEPGKIAGTADMPGGENYNLYQGLRVPPAKGNCELIKFHIWDVWCNQDWTLYQYVIRWLARMLQYPWLQGETVIVLKSKEGAGKNVILDFLVWVFGENGIMVTRDKDVTGQFNDHLGMTVFLHLNEAMWGGDKESEGAFKSLVTDPTILVEKKHIPKFPVRNCTHIIVSSNNDWIVPVGIGDRRIVILDVSEERIGDFVYFGKLKEFIWGGGGAAFLHYLQNLDIRDFNHRELPDLPSDVKVDHKVRSADSITKWLIDCVTEGAIRSEKLVPMLGHRETVTHSAGWDTGSIWVATGDLYNSYTQAMRGVARHLEAKNTFARKLRDRVAAEAQRETSGDDRRWGYRLPSHGQCLEILENMLGGPLQ